MREVDRTIVVRLANEIEEVCEMGGQIAIRKERAAGSLRNAAMNLEPGEAREFLMAVAGLLGPS